MRVAVAAPSARRRLNMSAFYWVSPDLWLRGRHTRAAAGIRVNRPR
jgi:hypothetical protein